MHTKKFRDLSENGEPQVSTRSRSQAQKMARNYENMADMK